MKTISLLKLRNRALNRLKAKKAAAPDATAVNPASDPLATYLDQIKANAPGHQLKQRTNKAFGYRIFLRERMQLAHTSS